MEPRKIQAPEIRVGDRIRVTTADHVTHELLVGSLPRRDIIVRPVESRSTATWIEMAPSDTVELLDRTATPTLVTATAGVSMLQRGDPLGGMIIETDFAFVLGEPDSGYVVIGGTYSELGAWLDGLKLHLGHDFDDPCEGC